jgi:superfamily II DNA or RNA helicase
MSLVVPTSSLSSEMVSKLNQDLILRIQSPYSSRPTYVDQYVIINDQAILPFAYAVQKLRMSRPKRDTFTQIKVVCNQDPRPEQEEVLIEATTTLNKTGSVLIAAYTGFGKTFCTIKLLTRIKLKGLVVSKGTELPKQWKEEFKKYCPDIVVQILDPGVEPDPDAHFYIINAQNIVKFSQDVFYDIGVIVVDEAHLIMAETLARSLRYLYPRYVIALTATPYRPDGLDSMLDLYFGEHKIIRKLWHPHTVYKVRTGFVPEVEYTTRNGKKTVIWESVLKSQAENVDRNELCVKILCHFSTRKFMVLTKRVAQNEYLYDRLTELGESVAIASSSTKVIDKSARILIGTINKLGVGFNHPDRDALMIAGDVEEYFIQYLGRVIRRKDVHPLIFDLYDNFYGLIRHFNTRAEIYEEHGGTIENFDIKILKDV